MPVIARARSEGIPSAQVCIACGENTRMTLAYPLPRSSIFQGLTVSVCRNCGLGTVDQRFEADQLRHYYENGYAKHASRDSKADPEHYFSDKSLMFKPQRSLSQLRLVDSRTTQAPRTILDLGAGFGTTLYLAKHEFWPDASLTAVEPDLAVQGHLAAIGCRHLPSLEDVAPESCDLIVASHVLEHYQADDIRDVLTKLKSLLSPHGLLLAEVPNSDFLANPEIGGHSHEPHLLFFSAQSFRTLVEKCGFRVSFLSTTGSLRRRSLPQRVASPLRRLMGRPAKEYGGDRAALRLLAS